MSKKKKEKNEQIEQEVVEQNGVEPSPVSEVDLLKQELEEYKNKYLLALATAKNDLQRYEREKVALSKYFLQEAIESFIPILDAFDMAFKCTSNNPEIKNYLVGFEYVQNTFIKVLNNFGLERISVECDDMFDPNVMAASETVTTNDLEKANKVVEVYSKGYRLNDRLLRAATVKIALLESEEKDAKEENIKEEEN